MDLQARAGRRPACGKHPSNTPAVSFGVPAGCCTAHLLAHDTTCDLLRDKAPRVVTQVFSGTATQTIRDDSLRIKGGSPCLKTNRTRRNLPALQQRVPGYSPKLPVRDSGSIQCSVCGHGLMSWKGSRDFAQSWKNAAALLSTADFRRLWPVVDFNSTPLGEPLLLMRSRGSAHQLNIRLSRSASLCYSDA